MNLPTKITIARICLIPIFVILFLLDFTYSDIIATVVFIIAACTDFIDGSLARKYNMVTDLGKFLDPIADKLLVVFALFLLSIKLDTYVVAFTVMSAIIISRELIISVFRQVAASKGKVMAADYLGKLKTIFIMIAIPLLMLGNYPFGRVYFFLHAGFVVFVISFILTVISAFNYIFKNKDVFKREDKKDSDSEKNIDNKFKDNETELAENVLSANADEEHDCAEKKEN